MHSIRIHGRVAVSLLFLVSSGCASEPRASDDVDPEPRPRPPVNDVRPDPPRDEPGDEPPPPPERVIDGTRLVTGRSRLGGVTDDGHLAYLYEPRHEDGTRTDWSAHVLDTRTGTPTLLARRRSVNDHIEVKKNAIGLWLNLRGPYGWGDFSVWTKATGHTPAPEPSQSLAGFWAIDDSSTRVAFSYGEVSASSLTSIALSGVAFDGAPAIVAPTLTLGCAPSLGFAGSTLLVSTCSGSSTVATLRQASADGVISTLTEELRAYSFDTSGEHVLVIESDGRATLHAAGAELELDTGVRSGRLFPNGDAVLYTTEDGALIRATTSEPITRTTLRLDGVHEVVLIAEDLSTALISSRPADAQNRVLRRDLQLITLATGAAWTLVDTPTAAPLFYTRSGSHVLYFADIPADGTDGMELRAAPVTGGAEIVLGTNPVEVHEPVGGDQLVWLERREDHDYDVKTAHLDRREAPQRVLEAVTGAVGYGHALYATVGEQGLYQLDLP